MEPFGAVNSFTTAFNGDPSRDRLNLPRGTTYTVQNDLNRLEVMNANEGPAVDRRLQDQFGDFQAYSDRTGEEGAVAEASGRADKNSANDAAQFERATRGMGMSARQQTSATRQLGLARSINRAEAAGGERRGFTGRAKAANASAGGFADALFSQRQSGETAISSAFAAKDAADKKARADKKAARIGAIAQVGGMALSFFSSEQLKHDRGHEAGLLDKLKNVRVNRWQYKGDNKTHVGPFSEEFNKEFGIDTDRPDMINVIDALGVTLGAVKELDKKISYGK